MVRKAAQQLKESRALNFASIDEPVDVDGNDEESASLGLNLGLKPHPMDPMDPKNLKFKHPMEKFPF